MQSTKQIALHLIAAYLSVNELGLMTERAKDKFGGLSVNNDTNVGATSSQDPEAFQKQFMGKDDQSAKEIQEWLVKATSEQNTIEKLAQDLNSRLKDNDYLVGNSTTAADITAFAYVNPYMASLSDEKRASLNYFTRWFDLIQNVIPADSMESVGFHKVVINTSTKV